MQENAIVLRTLGISKTYGNIAAVKDLNLEVRAHEIFGFLGPNGAGKSTTIGMILGLVRPTAGSIELFGRRLRSEADLRAALRKIGTLMEQPAFYPYLSGRDNLRILAELRGGIPATRIDEALNMVGLAESARRRFGAYSQGMKRRLGLAAALLHQPELVILDEPTNGMDPAGMHEVRLLIKRLRDEGTTVFLSSHLLHEVEQVCDRVMILNKGQAIAQGDVSQLLGGGASLEEFFLKVTGREPIQGSSLQDQNS